MAYSFPIKGLLKDYPDGEYWEIDAETRRSAAVLMETLEEFKNSFFYGSRSDLLFKFLESLAPDEAGEFFRLLLGEVGTAIDHGEVGRLADLVYEWQVRGYSPPPDRPAMWSYDSGFFAPMPASAI